MPITKLDLTNMYLMAINCSNPNMIQDKNYSTLSQKRTSDELTLFSVFKRFYALFMEQSNQINFT